jgi:DNA repair protein RecN (Recombination protein N)
MLEELDIQNVAVAEHVRLRFAPGFVALTGETGAGKSILIDALGLLLGGPADAALLRAGAERARVEGVFRLPEPPDEALAETLTEAGIEPEDGLLIVSRELPAQGRAVTRVNGRAVVQSALRAIGARLVDVHGQEDGLSILRAAEHLGYLDRFGGHAEQRAVVAALANELRSLRAELRRLTEDERERARRQDRLRFEVEEIGAAELQPDEEEQLRAERQVLANAEELGRLADAGYAALSESDEGASAVDALGSAADSLAQLARLDPRLSETAAQAEALQSQALELARELRAYRDQIEADPERLEQIEGRLALIGQLKRKYGQSIADVLAYAERAAAELETLTTSEERAERLAGEIAAASERLGAAAQALAEARRKAAARLSAAVEREIADLGLKGGRFAVHFQRPAAEEGVPSDLPMEELIGPEGAGACGEGRLVAFDRTGIDRVEFYVSLNPGEPLRPLARVASGGESARLMLALKTILGAADAVPTLVFDEVDVGVGGRSGHVVGEKLAALGEHHQVLCITHLPQVAARAGQHFAVAKRVEAERSFTEIRELDRESRERELAAMLGGVTEPNLRSAQAMLAQ